MATEVNTAARAGEPTRLIPFVFESTKVRVVVRDGQPWFFLVDVCRVLEIANPSDVAKRLDDDEKATLSRAEGAKFNDLGSLSGAMPTVVNESGLYSVIMTSRKPSARRFKKWVTGEVLPAIRRTGGYLVAAPHETFEMLTLRVLNVLKATVEQQHGALQALEAEAVQLRPKALVLKQLADADGSFCVSDAAKAIGINPDKVFDYLRTNKWMLRRGRGRQSREYAAQDQLNRGYLIHKMRPYTDRNGVSQMGQDVRVTPKGIVRLAEIFRKTEKPNASLEQGVLW